MITRQAPASQACVWAMSLTQARRRVHELEDEKAEVVRAMESLMQRFDGTFTPPCPMRPVVQRLAQGRVYLRWRLPGRNGDQPYIDLTGDVGRARLLVLPREVRLVYTRFARESAYLNLAHSLRHGEWIRLRQFMVENDALRVLDGIEAAPGE